MTPFLPLPASNSSDELSWIIELLEKDGMAFQEGPGDSGPFDQGSPFAQELLDDGRQASPYYGSTYGPGAPSPGSSDVSIAGKSPALATASLLQMPQSCVVLRPST